jgi:glycosyltransferase involved in cell wall biosynthesis
MATGSVVVIPSRQEPFGLVALEAMAMGKPVVATHVGGLPEVLEGADAVLVKPDDPTALAKAVMDILEKIESHPDFGARNRALAARFSIGRMVDRYQTVYA